LDEWQDVGVECEFSAAIRKGKGPAQYTVDLLVHTPMQSPSTKSALSWILRRVDSWLTRILTGDFGFDPIDCLIYRAMAEEKYFMPTLDAFPFPLMHTDLGRLNILVDDSFNISGYEILVVLADVT
jgi:hypothetical protein